MNHIELIEWRIRLYGHDGQSAAAEDLGLSLNTYADFEIGYVDTLNGRIGQSIPRLLELASMALEAGIHKWSRDQPDDPRIVDNLSVRAANCLINARVSMTVSRLSSMSDAEILSVPGMGKRSLNDIRRSVIIASNPAVGVVRK